MASNIAFNETTQEKFIVFTIANYHLALPIGNVLRVMKYTPETCGEFTKMGLARIGRYTIRILNLHERLGCEERSQLGENPPFLLIARTPQGEICGIPVDTPPDLIELPFGNMRSLPSLEPQSNLIDMVSHAAVISQGESTTTFFLVDVTRIGSSSPDKLTLLEP
jgi:purine-binding chemotaxis protein CheW